MINTSIVPNQESLRWAFDRRQPDQLAACLEQFLAAPFNFFEKKGHYYLKGFDNFYECACLPYGRNFNDMRKAVELSIINYLVREIPDKNAELRVASLGSGGLLQDLILVGKLWKEGFKKIHIFFCDLYNTRPKEVSEFAEFFNQLPLFSVITSYAPSFELAPHKFHAIWSVDCDFLYHPNGSGWRAVFQARSQLMPEGILFLFGGGEKLALSHQQVFDLHRRVHSLMDKLCASPELSRLQALDHIRITATKDPRIPNFDCPSLAVIAQILQKPLTLELYAHEAGTPLQRLKGSCYELVIGKLAQVDRLVIRYFKEDINASNESRILAITHIFIREIMTPQSRKDILLTFLDHS